MQCRGAGVFTRPCCGTRRRRPSWRAGGLAFCSVRVDDFDVFLVTWSLTCPFTCPFLHLYFLSVFSFHFSSPWARFYKLFSLVLCCQVEKNRLPVSLCLKGLGTKVHHSFCFSIVTPVFFLPSLSLPSKIRDDEADGSKDRFRCRH